MTMQQLTIQEFITQREITIGDIYVDKFWSNIADDKWIYVGIDMLQWMGFNRIDMRKAKNKYTEKLSQRFVNGVDYKQLSSTELRNSYVPSCGDIEMSNNIDSGNRTIHLIVSPDCFKETLMLIDTDRAKEIRTYYIQVEKLFKAYMRYCREFTQSQLDETQRKLIEAQESSNQFKMMVMKKTELRLDQYVYIASSRNYTMKNIFKVGMTTNINTRMAGYQTGRGSDDKFAYLFIMKCIDGRSVEQMLFTRLNTFRYEDSKELYQIHFTVLKDILMEFETFEQQSTEKINDMFATYYNSYSTMPIQSIEELAIDDIDAYMEDKFSERSQQYISPTDTEQHPFSLTDADVNERLAPYGVQLKEPYNGHCDSHNVFQCTSVLNHTITNSLDNIWRDRDQGACVFCRKHSILNQIPFYKYVDETYEFVCMYETFDALKQAEPTLPHQLIRNAIYEERWLTPQCGHIYSIVSPLEGKLNLLKPLSSSEDYVVTKLGINYRIMTDRAMLSTMRFIIAIDQTNGTIYSSKSATECSQKLRYVNSTRQLNRKTIAKYVGTTCEYGGYKWLRASSRVYNGVDTVNVNSL